MDVDLRIVVIDKNPLRAAVLQEGLREAGHCEVIHIDDTSDILARVNALTPDVIIIDLESPSRDGARTNVRGQPHDGPSDRHVRR